MPQFIREIFKINGVRTVGRVFIIDEIIARFEGKATTTGRESLLLPKAFNLECLDNHFLYIYPAIALIGDRHEICKPPSWSHPFFARDLTPEIVKEFLGVSANA